MMKRRLKDFGDPVTVKLYPDARHEAIILSLVTVAKTQSNRGKIEAANETLQKAFNACLAAATFGAAFFIVFGNVVLQAIFKPEFVAPISGIIPILAIATAVFAITWLGSLPTS